MDDSTQALLRRLAEKYVWWRSPDEPGLVLERVVAQVTTLGDYEDVQAVVAALGEEYLREVLRRAEAGQFDARSWTYWHYRLDLAEPGAVPPLPARRTA